jgi:hypothetical protein
LLLSILLSPFNLHLTLLFFILSKSLFLNLASHPIPINKCINSYLTINLKFYCLIKIDWSLTSLKYAAFLILLFCASIVSLCLPSSSLIPYLFVYCIYMYFDFSRLCIPPWVCCIHSLALQCADCCLLVWLTYESSLFLGVLSYCCNYVCEADLLFFIFFWPD